MVYWIFLLGKTAYDNTKMGLKMGLILVMDAFEMK